MFQLAGQGELCAWLARQDNPAGWGKGLARQAGSLGLGGSGWLGKRALAVQGRDIVVSQTGLSDSGWQEDLTDQLGNLALAGCLG